jgi:hypothetical protein
LSNVKNTRTPAGDPDRRAVGTERLTGGGCRIFDRVRRHGWQWWIGVAGAALEREPLDRLRGKLVFVLQAAEPVAESIELQELIVRQRFVDRRWRRERRPLSARCGLCSL